MAYFSFDLGWGQVWFFCCHWREAILISTAVGRSFILRGQNKRNQTKGQPMLALRVPHFSIFDFGARADWKVLSTSSATLVKLSGLPGVVGGAILYPILINLRSIK